VAAPSEQISARWIEGARRECVACGAPIKNLDRDVGVVRTRSGVREIVCMNCHMGRTDGAKA
jgi:hypothetical protein